MPVDVQSSTNSNCLMSAGNSKLGGPSGRPDISLASYGLPPSSSSSGRDFGMSLSRPGPSRSSLQPSLGQAPPQKTSYGAVIMKLENDRKQAKTARSAAAPQSLDEPDSAVPDQSDDTQLHPLQLQSWNSRNKATARATMDRIYWKTVPGDHCVPLTEAECYPYIKKIYDAIVSLDQIQDREYSSSSDIEKFRPKTGKWGKKPGLILAVANEVVELCIAIHTIGATGVFLGHHATEITEPDRMFTFAQRIHFMAHLLRGYKGKASQVMLSSFTREYLATIWTTLCGEQLAFYNWWRSLSSDEKLHQFEVAPYEDVPAYSPTAKEMEEIKARGHQEAAKQEQAEQQIRLSSQNASKRPADAVESPEAERPRKRPAQVAPSAPPAESEPVQNEAINEDIRFDAPFGDGADGDGLGGGMGLYGQEPFSRGGN